jgi:hypothetical protein
MTSIVVITAGRTGSWLIVENLRRQFVNVCQTHDPLYIPANDSICVISKRKNDFLAMISMQIGVKTNEYATYTNKDVEPFIIEVKDFTNFYLHYNAIYTQIKTDHYKKIIEIYYEDLLSDPQHLFSLFGIDALTDYGLASKCPYRYEKLVLNFIELKELYDSYEADKDNFLNDHPVYFNKDKDS